MLLNPASPVVLHRLGQQADVPDEVALRLCQVRQGTAKLFPGWRSSATNAGDDHPAIASDVRLLRPPADSRIDQCHLDAPSLARRLSWARSSRPLELTRVAFVGDDDLASVGLLRGEPPPEQVAVLDIDERVLATIADAASELRLDSRVRLERADLASPADFDRLRRTLGESFDLVISDPPYAEDGMLQFVEMGIALTAYSGEIHLAVPALLGEAWTDELLLATQQRLVEEGFVIDRVVPGQFTYETSDVVSSLVVARRMPGTRRGAPVMHRRSRFYTTRYIGGAAAPAIVEKTELKT